MHTLIILNQLALLHILQFYSFINTQILQNLIFLNICLQAVSGSFHFTHFILFIYLLIYFLYIIYLFIYSLTTSVAPILSECGTMGNFRYNGFSPSVAGRWRSKPVPANAFCRSRT